MDTAARQDEVGERLLLREATTEDKNFICNAWVKSYRKRSAEAKAVNGLVYFEHHPKLVVSLLAKSFVLVACDKNYPDEVWAFLVFETTPDSTVFHFAYTKSQLRRWGLQRRLLEVVQRHAPAEFFHSHQTDIGLVLAKKYRSTHNPYLRHG